MTENSVPRIRKLEKTGFGPVLIYLYIHHDKTNINFSELRRETKITSDALSSTLDYLQKDELITETETGKFPFMKTYTLTQKGFKVADYLLKAASEL
jgi:DNA-binding HxlR family transcriptional regulator